jgi:hypothetical protein
MGEAPYSMPRRLDTSCSTTAGWLTTMLIIVGTSSALVTRSAATVRSQRSGSNDGMMTWRPATHVSASVDDPSARWNMGAACRYVSASV